MRKQIRLTEAELMGLIKGIILEASGKRNLVSPEDAEAAGFAIDQDRWENGEFQEPTKTAKGYKVFSVKNGELYPPVIKNENSLPTPVGVWLPCSAPEICGYSEKMHRPMVMSGNTGSGGRGYGPMAYRPGWHLGDLPYAPQFLYKSNNKPIRYKGREIFPSDLVWAEVLYSNDVDYQDEAMAAGYTKSGKFSHALAGLQRIPKGGSYKYRTNPDPDTIPWAIAGAMKVERVLSYDEVDSILRANGITPPLVMSKREVQAIRNKLKTRDNGEATQQAVQGGKGVSAAETAGQAEGSKEKPTVGKAKVRDIEA